MKMFLVPMLMIILILGIVGIVMAEEDMSTKYDPMSGKTLTESEAQSNPNAQPLPDGLTGKVEPGMNYNAQTNQVADKPGGFGVDKGCSFCNTITAGSTDCNTGGGGGIKGEGQGSLTPQMDQAIQSVIGLVQSIASIMGPIKEVLSSGQGSTAANTGSSSTDLSLANGAQAGFANQQGQVDAAAGGACDYQNKQVCENVTTKNCGSSSGSNATGSNETIVNNSSAACTQETHEECRTQQVCVLKKDTAIPGQTIGSVLSGTTGNAVAGSEKDSSGNGLVGVALSQNNERAEAKTSIMEMGTLLDNSVNLKVNVRKQADIYTPDQIKTTITLQGASGEPAPYSEGSSQISSDQSSPITGNVIGSTSNGQFVKLVGHDLGLGGEKIGVDTLRSLDNLEANGVNLEVKDGESLIEFNKQKTYYNREIKETPYFVNKITNNNDGDNYFRLLQGGSNGNYLADKNKRTTVGDEVIRHPDITMKGIVIAKERQEMFMKGLVAKR
ncbi:Uncharacterised protein [uncultured archaeon]|nr:Uncharacterised protein [uncultured archaeon]